MAYFPVLNLFGLLIVGRTIVSTLTYPYQNSIMKDNLDRFNNKRLSDELLHLMRNFAHTIRMNSGYPAREDNQSSSAGGSQRTGGDKTSALSKTFDSRQEILSISEMRNLAELLLQYSEINNDLIKKGGTSQSFRTTTRLIVRALKAMDQLYV